MTADAIRTGTSQSANGPRSYGYFIDGAWREPADVLERRAPGTGVVVSMVGAGGAADVDAAVLAARRAFDRGVWSQAPATERARILNRAADLIDANSTPLAALDAEEGGKPIRLSEGDIAGAASLTRYAAGLAVQMHGTTHTNNGADHTGLVLREPAGVAGLITPWNFPALILCQKLPFALAAGCTVVVKPSELTSSSTLEIARLYAEAGLPDGVLNVVTGDGRAGGALAEHHGVDVLSFTGSTATGRKILTASQGNLKKLSLELGGKAANIVFADADLEDAAEGVIFGAFFNNGECCVSQARLLVQDSIADAFVTELEARARRVRVGQPLDHATDVGAMIDPGHLESVLGHISQGRTQGAKVVAGGSRATGPALDEGLFVQPTILDGVGRDMSVFREEIFGPVLTVSRFCDAEEAIALANSVDYGLANSVWSKNVDTVLPMAKALKSGTVYVNTTIDAPPTLPFGGYKASGVGREMGQAGFEEFTELKSVSIRTGKRSGTFAFGGTHERTA
ncbi:aldehyde dehydrogenase family protein (plasmid) [Embleya sp. NBC_00888]|uniref:aldehyde dehydrogenase family protein n=1 Tax=Embleya sp. NBC_00888 TaxID=2975960 RepID=UPI002F909541|nr:aldehyde dehydrogenase family protein [Embleya sp. NBC_00888]